MYSPRHAALFRLAAVVAPSITYRRLGLTGATYSTAVRRYGAAAGVPKDLLGPLLREGDPDSVREEAEAVLRRLEAWVAGA